MKAKRELEPELAKIEAEKGDDLQKMLFALDGIDKMSEK